jgi:(5-formylfuran-3-yl)methyl phosphate synthase
MIDEERIGSFVQSARRAGLLAGLAGSLRLGDIPALSEHAPDILGFRGALCDAGSREAHLAPARVQAVRAELDAKEVALRLAVGGECPA